MTKHEYISQLKEQLKLFDEEISSEIISDCENHFIDAGKKGKTEDEIAEELGNIDEIVEDLKQLYNTDSNSIHTEKKEESQTDTAKEFSKVPSSPTPCRKIILNADCACVLIHPSDDHLIHVHYENHGSEKDRLMYEFASEQKGEILYLDLTRKKMNNFGILLNRTNSPHIVIDIKLPSKFENIEAQGISGELKLLNVNITKIHLHEISGEIILDHVNSENGKLSTTSGNIQLNNCSIKIASIDSKSGSIRNLNGLSEQYIAKTLSGDIEAKHAKLLESRMETASGEVDAYDIASDHITISSKSGDANLNHSIIHTGHISSASGDSDAMDITAEKITIQSISGDASISSSKANHISIGSTSGDAEISSSRSAKINAHSTSGDVSVENEGNFDGEFKTVSGEIEIKISNHEDGYTASVNTMSGDVSMKLKHEGIHSRQKNGTFTFGNGGSNISASTVSGDITINA